MTYYFSNAGDDSAEGTSPERAWAHLDRLARVRLGPGDSVLLLAGSVFAETLSLSGSGSANAPIRVGTYPLHHDRNDAAGARIVAAEGPGVLLSNGSHWVIDGIEVECASEETLYPDLDGIDDPGAVAAASGHRPSHTNCGILVHVSFRAPQSDIVIRNCVVRGRGPDQNSEGILVRAETTHETAVPVLRDVSLLDNVVEDVGWRGIGSDGVSVDGDGSGIPWIAIHGLRMEGNTARRIGVQGICAFNATDVVMRRNRVEGAGRYRGAGAKWGPAGLWTWACSQALIELNEVTGMFDANTGADATGIDIDWNSERVTVRRNHCHGNMGCGIVTMSCRDSVIENNRVEGNWGKVNLGPGQIALCDYHTARGPHAIHGVTNVAIRNNLIILDRDNTAAISTVKITEGPAWQGVSFCDNRIVFFDHAVGQLAYEIGKETRVDTISGNHFYGAGERSVEHEQGSEAPRLHPFDGYAPQRVRGLRAEHQDNGVRLTWLASRDTGSGVHHFNVYRGMSPGFAPAYVNLVAQPETPACFDAEELAAGTWYYKVEAEDACGNTAGSIAAVRVEIQSSAAVES